MAASLAALVAWVLARKVVPIGVVGTRVVLYRLLKVAPALFRFVLAAGRVGKI